MVPENNLIFVDDELLTPKEVSAITKIKTTTLGSWRWSGKGTKVFARLGVDVRYRKSRSSDGSGAFKKLLPGQQSSRLMRETISILLIHYSNNSVRLFALKSRL